MRRRAAALSAIARIAAGGGPIQASPAASDRVGEVGALAQEAVAGMDRVRARRRRGGDDLVDAQVGVDGELAADRDDLVAGDGERRAAVGVGGDRDRRDAEPLRRAGDARDDLAAVGDQDRREHAADQCRAGSVCMYLAMMPSITSSAPPAIEPRRPSR